MNKEQVWELTKNQLGQEGKWITKENTEDLVSLVQSLESKLPPLILDIGTGGATSACIMALANNSSKVFTVDPSAPPVLFDTIRKTGTQGRIFFSLGISDDLIRTWDINVDMIFHDGLHEYHQVKKDSDFFDDFLKVGGIFAWHDHDLYPNTVGRAIDEFVEEHKNYKLISHRNNLIAFRKE